MPGYLRLNLTGNQVIDVIKYAGAGVAELVDALDLGSSAARHGGSSPFTRTKYGIITWNLHILGSIHNA